MKAEKLMAHHSYLFQSVHYCLFWLCLIMIFIQLSQAWNDDSSSSSSMENFNNHRLDRRNPRKVAKMLQQILQRGEMQVQPYRIREFLHRLHSRLAKN